MTCKVKASPNPFFWAFGNLWEPVGVCRVLSGPFRAFRHNLIALLSGDDASDPAAGFLDIVLVAGDEVDMGMGHGLACGGVDVDPYIEPIGVELLLEDGFDLVQQDEAVRLLLEGQIEVIGNVPGGDHQGMPLAHRKPIKNRIDRCGFSNHRPIAWEGTEVAGLCRTELSKDLTVCTVKPS